ncbi:MAG: uracil-DNA glycosylase [Thermodesulfobacteriota bacterium]|nr:uracil-DNA glycosylase [Thermodesulfobacteriota bacterium]
MRDADVASMDVKAWLWDVRDFLEFQIQQGFEEVFMPPHSGHYHSTLSLERVRKELGDCTRCGLSQTRNHIVFGEGNPHAGVMFIGEGPGAEEDREGRPFVGRAGALLTKMVGAMGLSRSDVYIANIVKCRPPRNRDPEAEEIAACLPFLELQVRSVNPKVVVALGRIAAGTLLQTTESIGKIRGTFYLRNGIKVMPTYHPSFLLRKEQERGYKAEAWSDLRQVMALLGLPVSAQGGTT